MCVSFVAVHLYDFHFVNEASQVEIPEIVTKWKDHWTQFWMYMYCRFWNMIVYCTTRISGSRKKNEHDYWQDLFFNSDVYHVSYQWYDMCDIGQNKFINIVTFCLWLCSHGNVDRISYWLYMWSCTDTINEVQFWMNN